MKPDKVFYDFLMRMVGLPYRWGGSNPMDGYDCSGLALEALMTVGEVPNRFDTTSKGLYKMFTAKTKGDVVKSLDLGTLAFYGPSKNKINHVGIGLNKFQIVEAAGGDSQTVNLIAAKMQGAYVRIRPWDYRADFVAFVRPKFFSLLD